MYVLIHNIYWLFAPSCLFLSLSRDSKCKPCDSHTNSEVTAAQYASTKDSTLHMTMYVSPTTSKEEKSIHSDP